MIDKVRFSYWLSVLSWLLLFALLCGSIITDHASNELPRSLQLIIIAGSMLLVLMGVLKGAPKSHLFAAVLAIVYFCIGVTNVLEAPSRVYGLLQIILSCGLFVGGVLYARWASQTQNNAGKEKLEYQPSSNSN